MVKEAQNNSSTHTPPTAHRWQLPSGINVFNFGNLLMYALQQVPTVATNVLHAPCWNASANGCRPEPVHCTYEEMHPNGLRERLRLAFAPAPTTRQSLSAELNRVPCIRKLVVAVAHLNGAWMDWRKPGPRELIIHFRCGDVPFRGSAAGYKLPRLQFYEQAIRRMGDDNGSVSEISIVMCAASHATWRDQRVDEAAYRIEACLRLARQLRDHLLRAFGSIRTVRVSECEQSALSDWLTFFHAPRLISSGSTFSLLPGFFSSFNHGRFVMAVPEGGSAVLCDTYAAGAPLFEVACAIPRQHTNESTDQLTSQTAEHLLREHGDVAFCREQPARCWT